MSRTHPLRPPHCACGRRRPLPPLAGHAATTAGGGATQFQCAQTAALAGTPPTAIPVRKLSCRNSTRILPASAAAATSRGTSPANRLPLRYTAPAVASSGGTRPESALWLRSTVAPAATRPVGRSSPEKAFLRSCRYPIRNAKSSPGTSPENQFRPRSRNASLGSRRSTAPTWPESRFPASESRLLRRSRWTSGARTDLGISPESALWESTSVRRSRSWSSDGGTRPVNAFLLRSTVRRPGANAGGRSPERRFPARARNRRAGSAATAGESAPVTRPGTREREARAESLETAAEGKGPDRPGAPARGLGGGAEVNAGAIDRHVGPHGAWGGSPGRASLGAGGGAADFYRPAPHPMTSGPGNVVARVTVRGARGRSGAGVLAGRVAALAAGTRWRVRTRPRTVPPRPHPMIRGRQFSEATGPHVSSSLLSTPGRRAGGPGPGGKRALYAPPVQEQRAQPRAGEAGQSSSSAAAAARWAPAVGASTNLGAPRLGSDDFVKLFPVLGSRETGTVSV
uniref:Uncharacterized protein n=1 Tax=Setaria italica TaxID=4555 RepID=K3ZI37_SETIT